MDDWVTAIVFFLLFGAIGWVLGIAGFFRAGRALRELAALRSQMAQPQTFVPQPVPEWSEPPPEPAMLEPAPAEPAPSIEPPPPTRKRADIEVLLTQRWGVWLGAAALLLAAVFLVRTAAENGWLGPAPRCAMAALLGLALLAAAEWLHRRPSAKTGLADLGPAALAAGAVAAWFAGAYGAGPLYGLVSAMAGFVLLAAASLAGLALSLRFGPLVAAVGLAGAFATPALVQTEDASAPGLFGYLLFVSAASWAVVRYTAWAWLGWAAAAAGAAWVVLFVTDLPAPGLWAPALFVPAAAALSLVLLPGAALDHRIGRILSWAPLTLLGAAGLLLAATSGDPTARMGVLLLAPLAVGKGWTEPRLAWLPFLPALLFGGVLLSWALPAWQPTGEAITIEGQIQAILPGAWAPAAIVPLLETAAAMAAWFAGMGLLLERRTPRPLPWAALVAVVPVATLALAYLQVGEFQPRDLWAAGALALAAALVGAAILARPGAAGTQRAGVHAAGAVAALSLGFAILLNEGWLTLAIALTLPALAWIEAAADLPGLRRVALGVALLVLVRLVLNPYVLDYDVGTWPILNPLLLAYGVPAICFAWSSVLFRRRADDLVVQVLEGGACAFFATLVALEVHHWVTAGTMQSWSPTFREWALQVSMAGAVAVLLQEQARRGRRPVIEAAWRIVGGLALAGGVLLLLFNPAITGEAVGPSLFGNALLPAYLVPAALAVLALYRGARPRRLLVAYAGLAAFTWATTEVRQAFHPSVLLYGDVTDAELWAYSGVWLLLGAALMAAGLRLGVRGLRLAALALVALAAGKVFLVDMSGLGGLWRVLSFLGLGVALIGLGAFYRRFVVEPVAEPRGG